MHPLLDLIADLYSQVRTLTAENAQLREAAAANEGSA